MAIRNQFMIKNSDILLSVYNQKNTKGSGTYLTINMAIKANKPVFNYNPITGQFTEYKPSTQFNLF